MKIRKKVNNNVIIFVMLALILVFTGVKVFAIDTSVVVPATSTAVPAAQTTVADKPVNEVKQPTSLPQKNAYALEKETGFKYAILKFLLAMLGVLLSSLAIFAGLKFYKKIVLKSDLKQTEIDYDKTLESPKNFKEAINLFLHKTNKR